MSTRKTVMLARFPGYNSGPAEHPDSSNWYMQTLMKCRPHGGVEKEMGARVTIYDSSHEKIDRVITWYLSDTPITMSRNRCLEHAKQLGVDIVLMLDNDMRPDTWTHRFWDECFPWIVDRESPAIIAAPYCGGGSYHNNIFVFRWEALTNSPIPNRLAQYIREEVEKKKGVEEVVAIGTGLMLIDMRVLDRLKKPYFYYEWKDSSESEKASTEDVTFTRDVSLAWWDVDDAGVFCHWDCWASHIKLAEVGKPIGLTPKSVGQLMYDRAFQQISDNNGKLHVDNMVEVNVKRPSREEVVAAFAKKPIYILRQEMKDRWNSQPDSHKVMDWDELKELVKHDFADIL